MEDASNSKRVALAAAMVAMQADCSIDAALVLLDELARDTDTPIDELAGMVIDRDVDFT